VAQRFSAAIKRLFPSEALAAEVKISVAKEFFRTLFSRAAKSRQKCGL
jgi:hypothetical protein